jgi:hypothetical protein
MDVLIKDRDDKVEMLRMALNLCELPVSYTQSDLIIRVLLKLEKVEGEFTLKDGIQIHHKWKDDWFEYAKKNK